MTTPWSDPAGPVVPSERSAFAKPPADPPGAYAGPPSPTAVPSDAYGQPYGQPAAPLYGQPAAPPYGQPAGGYQPGYPPAGPGWGAPSPPPGVVLVPGGPPLTAANPSQRALGRLYDSLGYAVLIAGAVFSMYLVLRDATDTDYAYGYPTSSSNGLEFLWIYPIIGGTWLVIVAYEGITIGLTGATLGDRLAGVRFVRAKDGSAPGLARGLGRGAFLGVSFVGCYGLAFLLMLFSMFFDSGTGRYQSWPDKIFGLQAVSTRG